MHIFHDYSTIIFQKSVGGMIFLRNGKLYAHRAEDTLGKCKCGKIKALEATQYTLVELEFKKGCFKEKFGETPNA